MAILGELDFRGFHYRYKLGDKPQGEWMIILGGALQSLNSWDNYLDYYNRSFRVVVCDLPGMGESDTLPRGYPMEFLADCLKHLLVVCLLAERIEPPLLFRWEPTAQLIEHAARRCTVAGCCPC